MTYKLTTLENGLKVLTVKMLNRASAGVAIAVKAGGRYEPKKISGVSHFLEHMLFKGTKKRNTRQIKEEIEGVGGVLNAFTAEEVTCYYAKLRKEHYPRALEVLSDMVLNATVPENELKKERTVILEEIKMYQDVPSYHVQELISELLWQGQPLGRNLAGTPETVSAMSRKDILDYKNAFYNGVNMLVAVSGDIEHEDVLRRVRQIFRTKKVQKKSKFVVADSSQSKPKTSYLEKKTEQTHFVLGFHSLPHSHPDRYKQTLLHVILGANMSSRLFDEVREKRGLAYEIKSGISGFYDTGAFTISVGVETSKVSKTVEVIMQELKKISSKVVAPEELRRAKEYYKSQVSLSVEDTLDHLFRAVEKTFRDDGMLDIKDTCEKIEKVTAEEILAVAKKIFRTNNINLALIGPVDSDYQKKITSKLKI